MEASQNSTPAEETSQDTSFQPTNNIQNVPYKKVDLTVFSTLFTEFTTYFLLY